MVPALLYAAVPIVAKGFAVVLSALPDLDLVATRSSAEQLPQAVAASDPDRCLGRVVRIQLAENKEPLIALEIAQMEFWEHKPAAEWGGPMLAAGGRYYHP
jgi:DNA-binding NarL/FixJ family response regulator